jgi:pimeloyl-ACP methyl ester carboxylesterase
MALMTPFVLPPVVPLAVPDRRLWLWELRVIPEAALGFALHRVTSGLPRGQSEPVFVLPGYGANDLAMQLLVRRLTSLGYSARSWGLGKNTGNLKKLIPAATEKVLALATQRGQKVQMVGWSLGGVMAREIARDHPDAVASIVTLGSPVVGAAKYTFVARAYKKRGFDLDRMEAAAAARDAVPIRVPITAIYDRHDAIVAWPACIDRVTPGVQHIEVNCSHLGMAFDNRVFRLIAKALATSAEPIQS